MMLPADLRAQRALDPGRDLHVLAAIDGAQLLDARRPR